MRKFYGILIVAVLLLSAVMFSTGCQGDAPPAPPPADFFYSDYGAVGDGETDDFTAIIAAHTAANAYGGKATVKAEEGAVYYIGSSLQDTAVIKTDVDWTGAKFIIDDTEVDSYVTLEEDDTRNPDTVINARVWKDSWIFRVAPSIEPYELNPETVMPFKKGQEQLYETTGNALKLPQDSVIVAVDSNVLRYIRTGNNVNDGSAQQDVFILRKDGSVDEDTPVIWDYDAVTKLTVYPIDETPLTIKGGHFVTWANQGSADNSFMKRGIHITRSNTVIDGITRDIEKERIPTNAGQAELDQSGASYTGFLYYENCAFVTLQNSQLCGHRTYRRPSDNAERGNYDIQANRTVHLSVINTDQLRDIKSRSWWGVFASNYSKNIVFDRVKFSRFDAHMGVYNTTIRDSELGHQGCSIIGSGTLTIEGTTIYGNENFIYFRNDYGSTWDGDLIIKDCIFAPTNIASARVISTGNNGTHDFGYETLMPQNVTIENLHVVDPGASNGVYLFFVSAQSVSAPHPLIWTKTLSISGFTSESGKSYRLSDNASFTSQLHVEHF